MADLRTWGTSGCAAYISIYWVLPTSNGSFPCSAHNLYGPHLLYRTCIDSHFVYVHTYPAPSQPHAVVTFLSLRFCPKEKEATLEINKRKLEQIVIRCNFQPLGRVVRSLISETIRVLTDIDTWIVETFGLLRCLIVQFVDRLFQNPCNMKQLTSTARSKRDGTCAETSFGLSAERTSPFKSAGVSVQSTTGSRGVRISGHRLYRPCSDVQCKTTGYPLHSHLSPSLPLPCVTACHQVTTALYQPDVTWDGRCFLFSLTKPTREKNDLFSFAGDHLLLWTFLDLPSF